MERVVEARLLVAIFVLGEEGALGELQKEPDTLDRSVEAEATSKVTPVTFVEPVPHAAWGVTDEQGDVAIGADAPTMDAELEQVVVRPMMSKSVFDVAVLSRIVPDVERWRIRLRRDDHCGGPRADLIGSRTGGPEA